jgi:hypothetical protein
MMPVPAAVYSNEVAMKAEQRTLYIARDGKEFRTAALCLAYEREHAGEHLVGLTAKQIAAARTGADPELAEVFRMFASGLRKAAPKRHERAAEMAVEKSAPPLPNGDGPDRTLDSAVRTDREPTVAPARHSPQSEGVGLEDGRTEAAP